MAIDATSTIQVSDDLHHVFPSLSPTLLISMGFIDLGKWVVAMEGGAHFGSNIVLLVLFFNCLTIFCQYLATCIGMVTGKDLAQICCEEYSRSACLSMGVQAEVSLILSEMTNILGIAHGLNLVFGVDLFTCTFLAAVVTAVPPILVTLLGKHNREVLYICISGFVLVLYVLGILIAQPEIPIVMNGMFPRLSGENSYLIMALLGSNIIVHNFYAQSSIVQQQRRLVNVAVDPLLHDHFFAILFIFSGIFLANCVLMNSATSLFENAGQVLHTFQDIFLLMDQMFSIHIAPIAFLLVLLFSSSVTALTLKLGGQVVMHSLLGINLSNWKHIMCIKALAIFPAIYCAQSAGAEGLYQLLIFCQVVLAMLLPSSVIPLFRAASSRTIMGNFNMPWYLELLALLTFIWMFASNIIFIVELVFGNSSWVVNVRTCVSFSFVVLLLVGCGSLGLTLYMMVTPLKSASNESNIHMWTGEFQNNQRLITRGKEGDLSIDYSESRESAVEPTLPDSEKSSVSDFNFDIPEMIADPNHGSYQSTSPSSLETVCTSSASDMKGSNSVPDLHPIETVNKLLVSGMPDSVILERIKTDEPAERIVGQEAAISESPEISRSSKGNCSDLDSGPGSLSRLSGLGRAARRQLTTILDEFWGHLFDFHGQLTQEASNNKVDILLGLDSKAVSSSLKADSLVGETLKKHLPEVERGLIFPTNSRDYSCPNQRIPNRVMYYGAQAGSTFSVPNTQLFHTYGQSSSGDLLDSGERRYSSLHLPQYSDSRDYQPATVHGYQLPSYLRGIGAGRHDSSGISPDQHGNSKSSESFVSNYRDPLTYTLGQDRLGSLGISGYENPQVTSITRLQAERACYLSSLGGNYENTATSEKKYHSLPDISGVSGRNSSFNNRNAYQGGRIGPRPSVGRITFEQSQCSNSGYRAEGAPLTFDELSPSKLYKDIFSLQSSSNADAKSLWSRQPFEQLFGMAGNSQRGGFGATDRHGLAPTETFSYAEVEAKLLKSLRVCIVKLLKLEGSDWLFRENNGADEELIYKLVLKERYLEEMDNGELGTTRFDGIQYLYDQELNLPQRRSDVDLVNNHLMPKCGESCSWRAGLVVCFGVWCIHRILELSLVESRPELWGKYTYVLNRLQGILEPAFSKPRFPPFPCPCLEIPEAYWKDYNHSHQKGHLLDTSKPGSARSTSSVTILDLVKDVEAAISSRKGRTGTAAGDVAFPKGKENLASVLKRYKRRLSNKSPGTHQSGLSSRKVPLPSTSVL